jgi:type I restriction-modification system DNA methylase subunit
MAVLKYNERSWAIDLISEINLYSASRPAFNIQAKGELGLKSSTNTLFPDILLYGINSVVQGWELKMPDTEITNLELLENAKKKADLLRLNSFLVWNGKDAALHVRNEADGTFSSIKSWNRPELHGRKEIEQKKSVWLSMLHEILNDIDYFLANGTLRAQVATQILDELFISRLIESVYKSDAITIQSAALMSEDLRSQIKDWANNFNINEDEQYEQLARLNLLAWANRFIFLHYLGRHNVVANQVQEINLDWDPEAVSKLFDSISNVADFANVFVPGIADGKISNEGWIARVGFNSFLTDLNLSEVPENAFRNVLENFALSSSRKQSGQFSTPYWLATALANIALNDLTKQAWDPCCGSGTIAKALYDTKVSAGLDRATSLSSLWASDKFQMPLQLTSISLSDPLALNSVVQVFQADVLDVQQQQEMTFTEPFDKGSVVKRNFPKVSAIASNLPFIRFETLNTSKGKTTPKTSRVTTPPAFSELARADIYAIITLSLAQHLEVDGRMAIIVSNSWLGTEWGETWQNLICDKYELIAVINSGAGRWFQNASVVTTILVLEAKRINQSSKPGRQINFVTTKLNLEMWNKEFVGHLKSAALNGTAHKEIGVISKDLKLINSRRSRGFLWRSNFYCDDWLDLVISKMARSTKYFEVARGSRRGWDPLFILDSVDASKIEADFLIPMLKTSSDQEYLIAEPSHLAFCCDRSIDELKRDRMNGALSWIDLFKNARNGMGKPLPEVLAKPPLEWFQMKPDEIGDFAISMNPDKKIVVFRVIEKCFMNQRLIRLNSKFDDPELLHALLNSCVSMLNIELLGFGRGQGALDLSAERLKNGFNILDPETLSAIQVRDIKLAFKPLLERPIFDINIELQQPDRKTFDSVVLGAFGLNELQDHIYDALIQAVNERHQTSS